MQSQSSKKSIAIIGAGPAGLIAAEYLSSLGHMVTVYDRMPSPLRKFLLAGRGGLNITHSEPLNAFLERYGPARERLQPAIAKFGPAEVQRWASELGQTTFVGSSGRVFPESFKATPLARAWLKRLTGAGVQFAFRHRWTGWETDGRLRFETPMGPQLITADATLLALGGASWPRLGSDGGWQAPLQDAGLAITPLVASNAGILIDWSEPFLSRHAGAPLKGAALTVGTQTIRAEAVITTKGLEGGGIYALSAATRTALGNGQAALHIDLKPDLTEASLAERLARSRQGESASNTLRKYAGLSPVAIGLLREAGHVHASRDPAVLAKAIKSVEIQIRGVDTIHRAISSAGGLAFSELDDALMLKKRPGTFAAGEMLDWDAPTGGYLLQACFSTGMAAAIGIANYLAET